MDLAPTLNMVPDEHGIHNCCRYTHMTCMAETCQSVVDLHSHILSAGSKREKGKTTGVFITVCCVYLSVCVVSFTEQPIPPEVGAGVVNGVSPDLTEGDCSL